MKPNRQKVHEKYNGHCAYCGIVIAIKDMQVDHLIPQRNYVWQLKNNFKIPPFLMHLTFSDVNHIDNLMPTCRSCNGFKSTFDLDLFRSEVSEQINRLRRSKPTFRLAERFGLIECRPKEIVFYFETLQGE